MPKNTSKIIIASAITCAVLALVALRFSQPRNPAATQDLKVPEYTSATFSDGDALKGLGPNWTYLQQREATAEDKTWFTGTAPLRESVVKLIKSNQQLILAEARVDDGTAFTTALEKFEKTELNGREAYVIPAGDLAGGTQILLVGPSTILAIQDANSAQWPSALDPEVAMYVQTVRVP